jgi:uncharacterized protein (TIGR03083 family)
VTAPAQPSIDGTRLSSAQYLAHLDADFEGLVAASGDLAADVPGCPGWTVRDLLSHVLGVYRHKLVALRTDAAPPPRDDEWGAVPEGGDVVAALRESYADLRAQLEARDADDPSWSWWPPEQTVGFWQRRMAQETTVHRWDAESAAGGPDSAGDVPDDLAVDGIDELLGWLRWPWDDEPQDDASGQKVLVATDDHSWTVTLGRTEVTVEAGAGEADALLAGPASGLLLQLWGRPGDHGVASTGDETALRLLRERLLMATS